MHDNKTPNADAILLNAVNYLDLGFGVLPILPNTKRAAVKWKKYMTQLADADTVRRWFSRGNRELAIVMGKVSGSLVVRDFDRLDAYEQWASEHPRYAKKLPTVETPRAAEPA